jgi:hypothetical protein
VHDQTRLTAGTARGHDDAQGRDQERAELPPLPPGQKPGVIFRSPLVSPSRQAAADELPFIQVVFRAPLALIMLLVMALETLDTTPMKQALHLQVLQREALVLTPSTESSQQSLCKQITRPRSSTISLFLPHC